jgi:hypothetical protein
MNRVGADLTIIKASAPVFRRRFRVNGARAILGLAIAAVGLFWPWIGRLGLGRLPGDILVHRDGFTFYAPITTGILLSVVLSVLFWLLSR